ncbi:hypothetical protein X975_03907, partial [Stegodyphus mimosarum]
MGIEDFKCSDAWLSRFNSRHNISCQTVLCGQSYDVNEDIYTNFSNKLAGLFSTYELLLL